MKIESTKLYILVRRNEVVWQLHTEGYSTGDISVMLNGLDRTWISRIIKMMPKGWTVEDISKHKTVQ